MNAGDIVLVDWRDALLGSGEPNKRRPGILVGDLPLFGGALPFEIVVPMTGEAALAIEGYSTRVEPTSENGCTRTCYALSWCVQTVARQRLTPTTSRLGAVDLSRIRRQIARCVGAFER